MSLPIKVPHLSSLDVLVLECLVSSRSAYSVTVRVITKSRLEEETTAKMLNKDRHLVFSFQCVDQTRQGKPDLVSKKQLGTLGDDDDSMLSSHPGSPLILVTGHLKRKSYRRHAKEKQVWSAWKRERERLLCQDFSSEKQVKSCKSEREPREEENGNYGQDTEWTSLPRMMIIMMIQANSSNREHDDEEKDLPLFGQYNSCKKLMVFKP